MCNYIKQYREIYNCIFIYVHLISIVLFQTKCRLTCFEKNLITNYIFYDVTSKCNIFLLISSLSCLICFLLTVIFYNELQINEIHLYYNACYLLYRHGIERVNWIFGKWMLPRLFNDTYRNCICDITMTSRFSVNFIIYLQRFNLSVKNL